MIAFTTHHANAHPITAWAWTLGTAIATALFAAPLAWAQGVTIVDCANPLQDAGGNDFGCLLSELTDADGGTITVEPNVEPAVKIIFKFAANGFRPKAAGVTPTDGSKITVVPIGLDGNTPGLQFTDTDNQWRVVGGAAPLAQFNNKNDLIEYFVEARDPETNELVPLIADAEVSIRPGAVTSDNEASPARAAAPDIVSTVEFDDKGKASKGDSLTPGGAEAFKTTVLSEGDNGERLEHTRTFAVQSAVHFQKEVPLRPGSADPNSVAEIEHIRQRVSLNAEKKVGCVPGTRTTSDGDEFELEFCAVPAEEKMIPNVGPFAQDNGAFSFPTADDATGESKTWHSLVPADFGANRTDHFVNLDAALQSEPSRLDNELVEDFSNVNNNNLLSVVISEFEPVFFGVVDALVRLIDLDGGRFADVAFIGDTVATNLGNFQIVELFKPFVNDAGNVQVQAELERPGDPRIRPALLVYKASSPLDDSVAVLIDSFVPGGTRETERGFVTLGESVFFAGGNSASGAFAIRSSSFGSGPDVLFLFDPGVGVPARYVVEKDEPLSTGEVVAIPPSEVSLNQRGDSAGVLSAVDPNAPLPVLTRRSLAAVFPATGGVIPAIGDRDPVPGIVDAEVFGIGRESIAINDAGQGMVQVFFRDADRFLRGAILGLTYDAAAGTVTLDDGPLLAAGDSVTGEDGPVREVRFLSFGTESQGQGARGINVTFTDGSEAVVILPTEGSTPANEAPVTDAGPDRIIDEGDTFASAGSFTDPDSSAWTATVDYGDASGEQALTLDPNSFVLSHTYADDGVFTVTVTVIDDDGGVGVDTATVTVTPSAEPVFGDFNGDGVVDTGDLPSFGHAYRAREGDPNYNPAADLDGDGRITLNDLRILRSLL